MESLMLGVIFVLALFYFIYKLYPKESCQCSDSKKDCCKNSLKRNR